MHSGSIRDFIRRTYSIAGLGVDFFELWFTLRALCMSEQAFEWEDNMRRVTHLPKANAIILAIETTKNSLSYVIGTHVF